MYWALPLAVAAGIVATLLIAPFSSRIEALLSRVGFALFSGEQIVPDPRRERLLRAAGVGTPYREYVVQTGMYVLGMGAAGAIAGVYLGGGAIRLLVAAGVTDPTAALFWPEGLPLVPADPPSIAGVSFVFFPLLLVTSASMAVFGGLTAHFLRWQIPGLRADTRRRQIDAGMSRMVAFIYALTRGGMAFPDVMRALARNEDVFGETATEMGIGVRSINLFNVDLVTAVRDLSTRTPSDQFESFTENLASVLQSGRNLSEFLHDEYERHREQAEEQQNEILELLATTAEIYVTTVVAGMLFLITILLVIGLTAGETLTLIQIIAYIVLPVGNLLFLAYLVELTQPLRAARDRREPAESSFDPDPALDPVSADGGIGYRQPSGRANHRRLTAYRRLQSVRETLARPVQSLLVRPTLILYVTVPIAVAVTLYRLPAALTEGAVIVTALDDILVQALLFVMTSFAVVYELSKYRFRQLEEAIPDLLERLASLNEAGVAVVRSFDRVRQSDMGALDAEVDRIWRDIQLGATVEQALERTERRLRSPAVTRVVTLITNAMRASNDIGPVLRIAAEQARADQRLRRLRRQAMFTYLVVIYVAFVVFLIVIAALDLVLIPNLPEAGAATGSLENQAPIFGEFEGADHEPYRRVFFHAAMIQAFLSGLVGGQMGSGTIKDGVKHATVMLGVTYIVLALL